MRDGVSTWKNHGGSMLLFVANASTRSAPAGVTDFAHAVESLLRAIGNTTRARSMHFPDCGGWARIAPSMASSCAGLHLTAMVAAYHAGLSAGRALCCRSIDPTVSRWSWWQHR